MSLRHIAAVAASAVLVFGLATLGVISALRSYAVPGTTVIGAVMTAATQARNQVPVSGADILLTSRLASGRAQTDASGFFDVTLQPGVRPGASVLLTVTHPGYKQLQLDVRRLDAPVLAYLEPLQPKIATRASPGGATTISDVRIRYTVKAGSTMNTGTLAQTFEAVNQGTKPCDHHEPCSPDGLFAAAVGSITLSAPEDGHFDNVRVSCIAGPCPFTRIDGIDRRENGHVIHVAAQTWSNTATFLVEADVDHTVVSDMVRESYPVIFGPALSFTLPGTAAGPSIEAEVNNAFTVFPLGPALHLEWATCTLKENPDHSKLYSCELRPGYRFQ